MLFEAIEQCREFIHNFNVQEYDNYGTSFKISSSIIFKSGDTLKIRMTAVRGSFFKYAYQWTAKNGKLICRWDNAPHWPDITTFPHHKHHNDEACISPSLEAGDLREILKIIAEYYRQSK